MLRTVVFVSVLVLAVAGMPVMAAPAGAPLAPAAQADSQQTPVEVVKSIADELAAKLKGHRQELKNHKGQLIKIIDEVFLPHFDVDYAAILVLGRHARTASPEQRAKFAKAFYESITHRYAEGLVNYTRGAVTVLPFRGQLDKRRTIVRTTVKLDNGKNLSVDYAFRKTPDGTWKVYDVIVEGISYIANYRNQVDAEIQKEGLDGLIKKLQDQGANALKKMQTEDGGGA